MIAYHHVDVFSRTPLSGDGLTIFPRSEGLTAGAMQRLTREMRQFESIFLRETAVAHTVAARIFTMEEELAFAGHPVLGAAALLHEQQQPDAAQRVWQLQLPAKTVRVTTQRGAHWITATMDQGAPVWQRPLPASHANRFLTALNLSPAHQHDSLPLQVFSTGLPYLIVPLKSGLAQAQINRPDFESLLAEVGAKFVYVFDVSRYEGRTWDNDGRIEDIATGSAAGPVGAYLVQHGLEPAGKAITLNQGRFVDRPSQMRVTVLGLPAQMTAVHVTGDVSRVGSGQLDLSPLMLAEMMG